MPFIHQPALHAATVETEVGRAALIKERLLAALIAGELGAVYQPQFDVSTGKIVAFEALARWTDAELGVVPPIEFIPIAEASGQIAELGNSVLKRVIADLDFLLAHWPAARVGVNVSGPELQSSEFVLKVTDALTPARCAGADHLEFEVTESAFHDDLPIVVSNLQALRNLGATVAIDDFGTGASTLARLCQIPFDKIKLDRAFVNTIDQPITKSVVRAIRTLADSVGAKLVVEGVETEEQLATLSGLGCSLIQGYLLGAPRTLDELVAEFGPSAVSGSR